MDTQMLTTVFNCCIAAGLAIPLFDLLIGGIGGALHFDLSFDGGSLFDGPVPFNIMSIAFGVIVFGASGRLCIGYFSPFATLAASAVTGVLGGYLISKYVVLPLRKSNPKALAMEELVGSQGTVKLEIRGDFVGTITVLSSIGSKITYDAKPVEGVEKIAIGAKVTVVDVDVAKRICTVEPLEEETVG